MAVIKKKTWPAAFEDILSGKKKFEFRAADFDIKEGDTLILEEYEPKTRKYTGRSIIKHVGYVAKFDVDSFRQKEVIEQNGFYVIQFK